MGRLAEEEGDLNAAGSYYQNALASDPTHYQALISLGLLKERQGDMDGAASLFARAKKVRQNDPMLAAFSRENHDRLSLRSDPSRRDRIMSLVKEISEKADATPAAPQDPWTSRPLTMSVMGVKSGGGIMSGGGQAHYLELKLHEFFEQSPLPVVERRALDVLLEEMELSRTKLADPETAVRVGRLLAARFIVTGDLTFLGTQVEVGLRVVETETGLVKASFSEGFETGDDYIGEVKSFTEKVTGDFLKKNPIRGRIEMVVGGEVVLNIGSKAGLKEGSRLNVYREEDVRPLTKSGRIVAYIEPPAPLAVIEVHRVESELAHARIKGEAAELAENMMVSLTEPKK